LLIGPSRFKFTEGLPFQVDQLPGGSPGEDGADEMCHMRALFSSGADQWEPYLC
jgi:hypothetical protein